MIKLIARLRKNIFQRPLALLIGHGCQNVEPLLCLYSLQQIQAIIFEFPAIFCKPLLQINNSTNFGASVPNFGSPDLTVKRGGPKLFSQDWNGTQVMFFF